MRQILIRLTLAAALVSIGWVAGKTQSAAPDFELSVSAPFGETQIRCERGCVLVWSERGINPNSTPQRSFEFNCSMRPGLEPPPAARCDSGRIAGWVRP